MALANTKMNMRTEPFDVILHKGSLDASSDLGAYSF